MKKFAKILSILLCLSMVIGMAAVAFADDSETTTASFTKVTTAPSDWSGTYLLVCDVDDTAKVFNGSNTADAVNNIVTATAGSTITIDPAYAVTIEAVDGGYTIKGSDGKYIFSSANANALRITTDAAEAAKYPNTITITDGELDIASSSGAHLRFNNNSDQQRYRYYKAASYDKQQAVSLYKLVEAAPEAPENPEAPTTTVLLPQYGKLPVPTKYGYINTDGSYGTSGENWYVVNGYLGQSAEINNIPGDASPIIEFDFGSEPLTLGGWEIVGFAADKAITSYKIDVKSSADGEWETVFTSSEEDFNGLTSTAVFPEIITVYALRVDVTGHNGGHIHLAEVAPLIPVETNVTPVTPKSATLYIYNDGEAMVETYGDPMDASCAIDGDKHFKEFGTASDPWAYHTNAYRQSGGSYTPTLVFDLTNDGTPTAVSQLTIYPFRGGQRFAPKSFVIQVKTAVDGEWITVHETVDHEWFFRDSDGKDRSTPLTVNFNAVEAYELRLLVTQMAGNAGQVGWNILEIELGSNTSEGTAPEVPTEPEVTEPEVTEPEVTEPEVTEPVVTDKVKVDLTGTVIGACSTNSATANSYAEFTWWSDGRPTWKPLGNFVDNNLDTTFSFGAGTGERADLYLDLSKNDNGYTAIDEFTIYHSSTGDVPSIMVVLVLADGTEWTKTYETNWVLYGGHTSLTEKFAETQNAVGMYIWQNGSDSAHFGDIEIYQYVETDDPEVPTDPTDPDPTDPEPTDPEPTDPEPTDPEPTDPEPTDPEPTIPEDDSMQKIDLSGSVVGCDSQDSATQSDYSQLTWYSTLNPGWKDLTIFTDGDYTNEIHWGLDPHERADVYIDLTKNTGAAVAVDQFRLHHSTYRDVPSVFFVLVLEDGTYVENTATLNWKQDVAADPFVFDYDQTYNAVGLYVWQNQNVEIRAAFGEIELYQRVEEPTDPEPTDPEPTDPEPTDPEPTDPEPTDPEPTDPEPTDPEPTDPEPTDPEPTDPEPTDPEPTDPEVPADKITATLTDKLEDGDKIVIYYNDGKTVIGTDLTGAEAVMDGDKLVVSEGMLVLTVTIDENGNITFVTEDGKYLTSGATGNSLTLADEASEYSLWVLEAKDGGVFIKNVNAAYNGNAQYLEHYKGKFTTYGFSATSDAKYYTFSLYALDSADVEDPTDPPVKTGDVLVSVLVGLIAISAIGGAVVVSKKKEM